MHLTTLLVDRSHHEYPTGSKLGFEIRIPGQKFSGCLKRFVLMFPPVSFFSLECVSSVVLEVCVCSIDFSRTELEAVTANPPL
jgi:hypothetical protein